MEKLLLTAEEAAEILRISRSGIYLLIQSGELDSIKVGGLRRIPIIAATNYVQRMLNEARADVA